MRRTSALAVLASLFLILPAQGQDIPIRSKAQPRPPQQTNFDRSARLPASLGDVQRDVPLAPLTDAQVLERMSRIYRYQSDMLMAQAKGDTEAVENLLDLAMTELGRLELQDGLIELPEGARYRELYRTVLTEYEKYYNVAPGDMQAQYGDVFALRADMFAAINDDVPLLENVEMPKLRPLETTIPMPMHRLVESNIAYLLRSPERHLYRWIERSETYFPMIEQILEEEGVPDELKYLAMVESGLNPKANSWAQAGGMWQFIRPTGAAYGLEADEWVDERMDPEKATRAAARHLRDLHKMFGGDWLLALSGYNCSPARIKRAISRAEARLGRKATFWDIYDDIPRETRNYVPSFIAAALLASNPQALDQSKINPGPRYEYDLVPVRGTMTLEQVASMSGTTEDVVRALNPELRRNMLPPTSSHYGLRLPAGTSATFLAAYEGLNANELEQEVTHVVKRGDTITKLARQYGTSAEALRTRNGIRGNTLASGQRLVIPYASAGTLRVAAEQVQTVQFRPRPRRQILASDGTSPRLRTPSNNVTHSAAPVQTVSSRPSEPRNTDTRNVSSSSSVAGSTTSTRIVYRVRRGDSLGEIASRYGTTVGEIRSWNRLSGSTIQTGQRLYLYTDGKAPEVASEPARTPAAATTHRVKRGETLGTIARQYGTSVRAIMSLNNLSSSNIQSGQRLRVQAGNTAAAPSRPTIHQVKRGETLTAISQKYGVSINDLKQWNNLRSGKIMVGQRLRLNS